MNEFRKRNCIRNKIKKKPYQSLKDKMDDEWLILPTGSVAPNTDEKLLSDTNALLCDAGAKFNETIRFKTPFDFDFFFFVSFIYVPTSGWAGGAGLPNISANGFPNCNRSSDAFELGGTAEAAVGPNKLTIFPELVGDDKNGLFTAADAPPVGDVIFDCCLKMDETDFEREL